MPTFELRLVSRGALLEGRQLRLGYRSSGSLAGLFLCLVEPDQRLGERGRSRRSGLGGRTASCTLIREVALHRGGSLDEVLLSLVQLAQRRRERG